MAEYSHRVPAADRTLTLLEVVARAPDGLTSAELLAEMGGSRSGLYALVNTLRARGYLDTESGRHRLGPALAGLLPDRPPLVDDLLEAFASESPLQVAAETVALSWADPQGVVVIAQAPAAHHVRVVYQPGSRRSVGSPDALVMAAGDEGDSSELAEVRRSGCSIRRDHDLVEIAVPVCADGVRPVAAVLCGLPLYRTTDEEVEEATARLRRLGARLSHHLGAPVYQPYGWASTEGVGPTRDLGPDEVDDFLLGAFGAQLACVRPDGTPHVVPLWYEWDGTTMWVPASPDASWRAHIAENPRVSVTIDEPWAPLRRLFLSGDATEVPDRSVPGGLAGLRRRLAVRYLGRGADGRHELVDTSGWAAVRIVPERMHGRQGLGRDHLRQVS